MSIPVLMGFAFFGTVVVAALWFATKGRGVERVIEHHESFGHISDPIERAGFRFEFRRLTKRVNERQALEFTEYVVDLPEPFRRLDLIDGEARHVRGELFPPEKPDEMGMPATEDAAFNGDFSLISPASDEVAPLLRDSEIRRHLLDLRQAYGGVWIDCGTLRVVESGRADAETIDINLELLVGILEQMRDRATAVLAAAGGEI